MNKHFAYVLAALVLLATTLAASPAAAYTCIGFDRCPVWCKPEVTYQIGTLPEGLAEADVVAEIQAAAKLWNVLDCSEFMFTYDGRAPDGPQTADIEINWHNPWDSNNGNGTTTYSAALVSYGTDDCLQPGEILMNGEHFDWNVDGTWSDTNVDVFSNAAVNFGRIVGLGTSDQPENSIMKPAPEAAITQLGSDDIDGFCELYAEIMVADVGVAEPDMGSSTPDAGPDPGTPDAGTPDPGNPTPDMGSTPDPGGNGADAGGTGNGNGNEVTLIDEDDEDAGGCSTVSARSLPTPLLAAVLLCLVALRRTRRVA